MKLHELTNTPGARKPRKRVGRGDGSGSGHTAARGHKGAGSRSGSSYRPYFEGGQIPFFRRLPKRGFNHPTHKEYSVINVGEISQAFEANAAVDAEILVGKALIAKIKKSGLKILGDGEIDKPLTIKAHCFSASARAKIEAAGGKCEEAQ